MVDCGGFYPCKCLEKKSITTVQDPYLRCCLFGLWLRFGRSRFLQKTQETRQVNTRNKYVYLYFYEQYVSSFWKLFIYPTVGSAKNQRANTRQRREQVIYRATSICMENTGNKSTLNSIFSNSGYLCPDGMCTNTEFVSRVRSLGYGDVHGMGILNIAIL